MLGARPPSTPLHHQCEGRPPTFQASHATRSTNSAVASAACLEGPGARYSICGCIERPAFPAPSVLREANELAKLGRKSRRGIAECCPVAWYDGYWHKERLVYRGSTSHRVRR